MATQTYVPLATQTLGSATSSITFSSIPSGYTDLRIRISGTISVAYNFLQIQFNGDTGNNYSFDVGAGNGSTNSGQQLSGTNSLQAPYAWGIASTTLPFSQIVDVFSYTRAQFKAILVKTGASANGATNQNVEWGTGIWRSTATITSITISVSGANNLGAGTIATIWGI